MLLETSQISIMELFLRKNIKAFALKLWIINTSLVWTFNCNCEFLKSACFRKPYNQKIRERFRIHYCERSVNNVSMLRVMYGFENMKMGHRILQI